MDTTAPPTAHKLEAVTVSANGTLFATCECGAELFARYSVDPGELPTRSSDGASASVEVFDERGGCAHLRELDFAKHEATGDGFTALVERLGHSPWGALC